MAKLEESHLDDYVVDNEYTVTYINDEGKEKQINFKPRKNTNIAGVQKQLGEAYKDFFKLKDIKQVGAKKTESRLVDPNVKESNEDIMNGKALSVTDKEIISFVEDKLEAELGKDWKKKSLIDIEDITYDAVYEWGNNHDEEDIHPQPYYRELKRLIGRLEEGKEMDRQLSVAEKILLDAIKSVGDYSLDDVVCETSPKGNVHIMTKDGKDICTVTRSKFAINGDDTELIDELRDDGYWKDDRDTLEEEEVLIEKENEYDTMAFAQNLPMSFTDYVDNHIADDYTEKGDNYRNRENFIEDYVLEYQDNYLDNEEAEEFNYDLAKDYVRYKLDNTKLEETRVNRTLHKGDKFVNPNGAEIKIINVDNEHLLDGEPQVTYQIGKDLKCYKQSSVNATIDQNSYVLQESKKIEEASALSAKDDNNVVIVNKNQYGYNTIAIIIDNTNKRYQLVSGQSLPTGKYKKASKKAIRAKAEDLKAQGYEEIKGPNSLAESKEVKTDKDVINEGKVTTPKGEFNYEEIKANEKKVKDAFKAFWNGEMTGAELEALKNEMSKVMTWGEIENAQYYASREAEKKEEVVDLNQVKADWEEKETLEEEMLVERVKEDGDNVTITEYTISFEDLNEEYYSTKEEADARMEELKAEGKLDTVSQYFRKDWDWDNTTDEYVEGYVEVYFSKE